MRITPIVFEHNLGWHSLFVRLWTESAVVSSLRHPLVRDGDPSWSLPCKIVPASLCPSGHRRTLKFWPNEMTDRARCVRTRVSSHDPFDIYLVGMKVYFTHGTVSDFHGARNRFQPSFAFSLQSVADFLIFPYDVHYIIIQCKLLFSKLDNNLPQKTHVHQYHSNVANHL